MIDDLEQARQHAETSPDWVEVRLEIDGVSKHGWVVKDHINDPDVLLGLVQKLIKNYLE